MLKTKQRSRNGQMNDTEWWAAVKVAGLALAAIALGLAVIYPFI